MIKTLKDKKVLLIGDVHGRTAWQKPLESNDYDLVIFMGDYFDPYDPSLREGMYVNFENIVSLKEADPEKFLLIVGNHDGHYIGMSRASRWSIDTETQYGERLKNLVDLGILQKAYMMEGLDKPVLFTHAGLSRTFFWTTIMSLSDEAKAFWESDRQVERVPVIPDKEIEKLEDYINALDMQFFNFDGPFWDYYGTWHGQGPMWIRPQGLVSSWIKQIKQVVGHTQLQVPPCWVKAGDDPQGLFLCDNGNYYTEIINGEFIVKAYEKNNPNQLL